MYFKLYLTVLILKNVLKIDVYSSIFENNLIVEYYRMKNINKVIIFSSENFTSLSSILMENNIYVSIYNSNTISKEEIKKLNLKHGQQGFVLNSDCINTPLILKECAEELLFFDKYYWLIFGKNKNIFTYLRDIYINVNAEITVVILNTSINWNLVDVYNPGYKHGGKLKICNLGKWNPYTGFNFTNTVTTPKYLRRKDLSEVNLSGLVILIYKYPGDLLDYLYNNEANKRKENYTRFYFLLFSHIKDIHNFTLKVELGSIYGSMAPNGSFNGLVGALQRKEVDVGLTPLYCKADRIPFIDYLVPTYIMKTRFLFRHPKPALTISGAFFTPLTNTVWLCTWGVMVITIIIIRLAFKYEWKIERMENNENSYTEHDWSYIVLLIFGEICQQDVSRVPNMYSGRIIVFICIFFTYMLYQFYSGGIVSSLLSEPPKTIKNLEDLLHSSLKIGVEDVIYEHDYFDQTTDPIAIDLYKNKMAGTKNGSDAFYNEKTGMKLIEQGGFAFQTDTSAGYAIIAENFSNEIICELGEVELYPTQSAIGVVPKHSPYKELLRYSFQRMVEAGIVYRQRIRWTTRKPECIKITDSNTIFVGIKEFFPALLFFIIGILISIFILGAEIYIHKKMHKRHNKFKY